MSNLDVWYAHADVDQLQAEYDSELKKRQRKAVGKGMAKARTADSMQAVAKLTHLVDGRPRIIADPPLLVPIADLLPKDTDQAAFEAQIKDLLATYQGTLETDRRYLLEQYEYADMARKVVGVGSVGTRCWIVLMFGRDDSDPLFLQVKEAEASVLSRFVGASAYTNMGERVVAGQRLMQASSDIFLGWQRAEAGLDGQQRDFYVRQLRDWKYSITIEALLPHGIADLRGTVRVVAGAGARPLRRPDRDRRLPRRLRRVRPGHHRSSPPPTPTRTSATSRLLSTPSHQDGSPPSRVCDIGGRATRRTSPAPPLMDRDRARGRRYRLVLRGELGEPFAFLFEGMRMERLAGTTVLTGNVTDQAHLVGLIERTQELGLELVSIGPADEAATDPPHAVPRRERRGLRDGSAEGS